MTGRSLRALLDALLEDLGINFDDPATQYMARKTLLLALCAEHVETHADLLEVVELMQFNPTQFEWMAGGAVEHWQPRRVVGLARTTAALTKGTNCPCLLASDGACASRQLFVDVHRALRVLLADD